MTGPAASCTVELTTGTRIYVAHTPDEVMKLLSGGGYGDMWVEFRRMADPDGWRVCVQSDSIVAIYPLDLAPAASEQREVAVTLVRPFELVSKIRGAWFGRP